MYNNGVEETNDGRWKKHTIRQFEGLHNQLELLAGFQVVNKSEVNVQAPVMEYLPEKNRIIILATECILTPANEDGVQKAVYNTLQMISDDLGKTWDYCYPVYDNNGNPVVHWCDSLEYLGKGQVVFHSSDANALGTGEGSLIWYSKDYGNTWNEYFHFLKEKDGKELYLWGDGIFASKQYPVFKSEVKGKSIESGHPHNYSQSDQPIEIGKPMLSVHSIEPSQPMLPVQSIEPDQPMQSVQSIEPDQPMQSVQGWHGFIIASGYNEGQVYPTDKSLAGFRISYDSCKTWAETVRVPEWQGFSEVSIIQGANGDLIAALRKDMPIKFKKSHDDNYSGIGTSFSTDGGATWSEVNILYDWGRHFPSLVLMKNGDIVMTYVVRRGYPETEEGYPQFGIEAVVSYDNGRSWDLDHRYILADWKGSSKGPISWLYGCQNTTTVLIPDDSLMTVFSYGPESKPDPMHPKIGAKYDIGLVHWRLNSRKASLKAENSINNAPFDSDTRNKTDNRPLYNCLKKWKEINSNIAIKEVGATVTASSCDIHPSCVLYDRFTRPFLTLETIPAWIEIEWPQEHLINEIHIHPGAPAICTHPETECVPLDYRLLCQADGKWVDIIPPVENAKRYDGFKHFTLSRDEFEYVHKFSPLLVKKIMIYITRTSDSGKRRVLGDVVAVPLEKRKTVLRWIQVNETDNTFED